MKKKRSKTRRLSDEGSEATNLAPDGANSDEYRQPKKTKSRLRRRRDSYAEPDSDSDASNIEARRKRRKRKKRGGSKTPAATTEESSEWDDAGSRVRKGSKATLADEKEKTKEITEKDLVARMQRLIPYLPPDSPLWTKWTLGPLYYFIRRAQSTLVIAICLNSLEKSTKNSKNNKNNTNTTSNNSHPTTSSKVLNRLLRICKPINGTSFITFNQLIPDYKGDFFYFVKASRVKLDGFNYDDMVVCGNVSSSHTASLNSLLLHLWTPLLLEKEFIPDGIKDELLTDLNTISCSCRTITHAQESGQLLLFVPQESYLDERSDMELSKDKEFCVRLEETIVYWLTKLKEVLILKELNDSEGWPAPLDEVQFWKLRSKNLEAVLSQVRSNTVKKTLRILALSRSPYIEELQKISKKLIQSWSEAASNAHYLKTLLPICYRLPRLRLKEIPDEIQKFLWLTLIIWRNSSHYNSSQRLNGLLRKFSNAIIIECRKRIKVNLVLEGKVISTGQMMRNCLKCLNWWKEKFATTEAMHLARYSDITWIFDYDQIFTHVDSMIHRLKDLLEICETQKLYGRKIDDTEEREPLPLYPGTRGLYITKVMKSIENILNSKLNELFSVSHLCLDVKSIEWHAHMQSFKETVLSIEMTIQNLLEETFDQMSNLQQKLELLQLFFKFYTREIISRQIDKLTILLFEYFEAEVLRLRKLFEQKIVPLPMTFSQMAGRGAWASHMKKRLDFNLGMLKKAESWLPKSRFSDIVKQEAKSLSDSISIYAKKTYEEWTTKELEKKDYLSKLKIPLLLRQGRDKKGIVEMNFDRRVYYNLAEAEMWQRVGRAVPLVLLLSIYPLRERLHTLRTNVSAVAKHYNRIVCSLSRDEKLLFRETLLPLEKKIYPCLSEFTWAPDPTLPTTVDHVFLEEFLKLASQIRGSILLYRNANFRIANITFGISNQKMIEINEKTVYTQASFRAQLNDKILKELKEIMKDYKSICKVLQVALQIFRDDGPAVKIQWGKYVKMIDECVEEALCTSLRSSLEHLADVICSSDKPIFKLELKLDSNLGQIIFEPRLEDLSEMILGVHENIAMAFENLPRVSQFFGTFSPDAKPAVSLPTSFTSTLLNDDVSLGIQDRIRFTIEKCFSELNLYMDRWVPYRDIWELDKEEFVKSYGINNPGVKAYEKDLSKYLELSKVVHGSESMITVQFCELDCTPFKTGVSEESEKWFHLLANSLYYKPKSTLKGLYEYMESNQRKFSKEPGNIQEQIEAFKLLQNIKAEANQKVLTFPGIQEQFGMLKKFNFNIESEVQTLADNLGREWKAYLKSLIAADNHLQMSYDKLRTAFLDQDCNFINSVNELVQSYEKEGPFSTTKADAFQLEDGGEGGPCEKALAQLDHFENKLVLFKQEENELILSLKSFNITKGHNKTLIALETEIGSLRKVWKTVQEWDIHWNQWKIIQVQSLQPEMMNKVSYKFLQVFQKLSKEFEAKSWPVIGETIEFLENFQGSMKTVTFLKNETLRDRHWERIKGIVGSKLDPHSQDFNLETIVSLRLHAYFQEVAEISLASGKETAIENTLKTIEQYWKGEYFGVTHRKGFPVPFQIHCNENLKDSLMDHIVSLSAMKGSQFIEPFLEKIEFWEGTLAKVNQIVDQLLAIQEEWLFMEMVFSDQDIQRELSQQAKHFKNVKSLWGSIVLIITENRNVIMAVNQAEDLKEMLNHLEEQMERLRKELQTMLHKKRQEFPRFYFLSDSLLLECLAGSLKRGRNNLGRIIQQMYPNVEKLFLGSQTEESFPPAMKVIDAVICKQGESLQLLKPVEMIGPVESWFESFDFTLKSTVKSNLRSCLENLRQNITRMDLWMMEWPSQSCLTALEIQWTLDVTRALLHISSTVENVVEQSTGEYTLKKISRRLKRSFVKLTEILKEQQNENGGRLKVAGILMTIMYLRDVTERLYLRNCSDVNSFEWLQYLRCYWERDTNECLVRQAEASFEYGYEFIGNSERAVITPLTERCFMGLTTALSFHFGAFIYGTSNAGKKETINELGRKLGMHMVNLSMSSCTDYEHLSRKLIGLVQTGSWGILSHIENCQPEIISFLTDRLSVIMKGKCQNVEKLVLSGFEVNLEQSCAIFVLMRRDAKGNKVDLSGLKSTLRPVALIQPDTKNILDVKLFIGGFDNSTSLAKKLETIFTTARSILCSQNHCNFSLDGMLAVVKQAMEFKTTYGKRLSESESIIKAIQNIVTPALSSEENVIFASLIKDMFPNEEPLKVENAALENMIGDAIKLIGYQKSDKLIKSCLRLCEIMEVYKTVIITGCSGSGKTAMRNATRYALDLGTSENENLSPIKEFVINASIFDPYELFGKINVSTGELKDGLITKILRASNESKHQDDLNLNCPIWIVFDGPMQKEWMEEGIHSIFDKDCAITLYNCDKVSVGPQVKLFFEVDDLSDASPRTIAKSGVIYLSEDIQQWKLTFKAWINKLPLITIKAKLSEFLKSYLERSLQYRIEHCTSYVSALRDGTMITMFIQLMNSFLTLSLETLVEKNEDKFFLLLKQIVAFCITWSVFGIVNAESRLKASAFLKDLDPQVFPTKRTVFDYFVDIQSQKWVKWEDLMETHLANVPRVIVHTVDTFRIEYLMRQFHHNLYPVLLTGYSSAGKTKLIKSAFKPSQKFTNIFLHIQMTPLMKAKWVQSLIETRLELVSSFVMSPPRGKSLAVFIDDLHVSQNVSKYSQHNEFLRHFVENHLWYDQYVGNPIAVSNVSIIAAMKLNQTQHHNIGIPSRLLSKFAVLYLPKPDEFQLRRIFTAILKDKLNEFPPSVKLLADGITVVTLEVFKLISNQLLPIPTQPLHTFDLQDISRVYDGLLRSDKGIQDTKLCFLRHWFHECNRVFYDRLMDASSRQKCRSILSEQLLKHFEKTVESLFPPGSFSVFGNFMSTQKLYEEIRDEVAIKKLLETVDAKLYKTMRMSFRSTVLFRQAMFQVAKIARAISVNNGHSIVIGGDGQGRKTLTRLCATLYGYKILELPTSTKYTHVNHSVALLSLLKEAYYICICENSGCCIILKDDNISRDTLELVSLVISTVDIPNLYTARELQEIRQKLLKSAPAGFKDDPISLHELFRQRVERNFHLILCMNPNAKDFRSYISTYGNILKDMTINWFDIWTRESFLEVAKHLLPSPSILNQDDPIYSGSIFHSFHSIASQISKNVTENDFGKFAFVTPIHFIDFVEQYNRLTNDKGSSTYEKIKSFRLAIKEINGVQEKIDYLTEQASTCGSKAHLSREECEAYHKILEEQSSDTEEQAQLVKEKSGELGTEVKEYQELADVIKDEWTGALEAFEQSNSILQDLAEDDLTHIRSYYSPPPIVSKVLDSVMIMIDREPTWPEAKIQLGHPDFIRNIMEFDKARITQEKLSKIRKYIQNTEFTPEAVVKHSNGARILCAWIHAIEKYGRTYLTKIAPKRIKLEESESSIGEKRNALDLQTQKLQILRENLTEIQAFYETKQQLKEDSEIALENANAVLGRAASVLRLLEDDLLKWEEEIGELETKLENLPGDALLAAAYLTYLGSFSFEFRKELKEQWLLEIQSRNETRTVLKLSSEWDLENFLGAQLQSLKAAKDLPLSQNDKFIEENIFILVKSRRLVLAIDPYDIMPLIDNDSEAIVHKVQSDDASILDAYQNYLDSELGNFPSQQVVFTSHSDGEYGPTIASRFAIVNFIITLDELRNYFTSKLSGKIHPELKVSQRELLQNLLDEKCQIEELKQNILRLIISYGSKILQNGEFPEKLKDLKNGISNAETKCKEIQNGLLEIEQKQSQFTPVAETLVILFQSIYELSKIDSVHQISLTFFITLMESVINTLSLESSRRNLMEIVNLLKENLISYFYRFFIRSMFKQQRFQFALLLCIKILYANNELDLAQLELLAKVNSKVEEWAEEDDNNEEEWLTLSSSQLQKLLTLENLPKFQGLLQSMREHPNAWQVWLKYFEPENKIPDVWPVELKSYEKLILLSILRPDRLPSQIKSFTTEVLGKELADYINVSLIDLQQIHSETSCITPVLFLLDEHGSPDPLNSISTLCSSLKPSPKFYSLTISKQNSHLAKKLFDEGVEEGHWIYFSNCHCALAFISELAMRMEELKLKLINETEKQKQIIHPSFRLWLSLKGRPTTEFPLELLRLSIKIAVEQSQTLQMNMLRLYQKMPASVLQIQSHHNLDSFKRLLFGLSFMHSSLVSRSKFQTFMNVNIARVKDDQGSLEDNDFEVASAILKLFTSKYERIPWWALKYMLELQYANHSLAITELRVVTTYLNKIFCEEALSNQDFKFSSTAPNLIMPPTGISSLRNGDLSSYHNFITSNYPSSDDDPEIYGLDPYVGVARNVHQAHRIFHPFQQLLMRNIKLEKMKQQQEQVVQNECVATAEQVQAQQRSSQKQNSQGRANLMMRMVLVDDELDKTLTKIAFILKQLPKPVDESPLKKKMHENLNPCDQPLYYVLLLELRQYKNLVKTVTSLLQILNEAIQGYDHVMTDEMSLLFDCVNKNIVPDWWQKDYSNTNDLGCWLKDLKVRVNQINCLTLSPTLPTTVWLGGFIYPKAFLTAVLQVLISTSVPRAARECGKQISQLCWNFKISNERDELNSKTASEGICVKGMYLLGANWDTENSYLKESLPFDYSVEIPLVQLIPVETIEKIHSDIYEAPCYKDCSPINNSSLVCWIDLNPGKDTVDNWILRNVTVLLINPAVS